MPYGNYIEMGGEGSHLDYIQFSPRHPEDFKKWFLEQTQHPDNADFMDGILENKFAHAHGHGHGHDDHGHGHDDHHH